jgi:hypothetical protein
VNITHLFSSLILAIIDFVSANRVEITVVVILWVAFKIFLFVKEIRLFRKKPRYEDSWGAILVRMGLTQKDDFPRISLSYLTFNSCVMTSDFPVEITLQNSLCTIAVYENRYGSDKTHIHYQKHNGVDHLMIYVRLGSERFGYLLAGLMSSELSVEFNTPMFNANKIPASEPLALENCTFWQQKLKSE